MQKAIAVVAALLAGVAGWAAATTPPEKTAQHKIARHGTAPHQSAAASASKNKKTAPARRTNHEPAAPTAAAHSAHSAPSKWRPGQTAPTPDRYKEIQEALAKKGYLHGEATGVWNQDSADALRHFQQDQNLQASGKLDSLSIIALGLGPKY